MFFTKKNKQDLLKVFERIGADIGEVQNEITNLEQKLNNQHNRIDKISDYIQGPLQDVINKAINNYFKELEKIIKNKNSNKKDK